MQRFLLLCLAVAAIVWLGFSVFPGHSYLYGETQIYVPVMERLAQPGFLSRDLVAIHPYVTYTIYDEVTLFLHQVFHLNFQMALAIQQVLCRAALVSGIFQLASAAGLDDVFALLVAALFQLGATLPGPAVSTIAREPTPTAFAFGLVLLAIGLSAKRRVLLGGLSGGQAADQRWAERGQGPGRLGAAEDPGEGQQGDRGEGQGSPGGRWHHRDRQVGGAAGARWPCSRAGRRAPAGPVLPGRPPCSGPAAVPAAGARVPGTFFDTSPARPPNQAAPVMFVTLPCVTTGRARLLTFRRSRAMLPSAVMCQVTVG